jgi:molybdenum cofactor cytidylyltransferase
VRFGETPIDEASGAILAHSRRADGVNFAKGRVLSDEDIARLKEAGVSTVVAARLDADDMHEDEAAATVARALAGEGIEVTAAFTGRCNHFAREAGLAVLDQERIDALNQGPRQGREHDHQAPDLARQHTERRAPRRA